jgi:predicted phage terminase large subunit-like protein
MSIEELQSRRVAMGSAAFAAQFQQDPVPAGGRTFMAGWMERTYTDAPECRFKVLSIDSAWKTGPQNDYSVLATWGFNGVDFYLLDVMRGRWEFPELARRVVERYGALKPNAVIVEEQQSGLAILQQLKSTTGIPLIPLRPSGTKESRALAVTPYFEGGKVVLPERAPWLDAWLHEHLRFQSDKHDDQVDTTSMALSYLSMLTVAPRTDYSKFRGFMGR